MRFSGFWTQFRRLVWVGTNGFLDCVEFCRLLGISGFSRMKQCHTRMAWGWYAYGGHSQGAIRVWYAVALSQIPCTGVLRMRAYEDAHTRMGIIKEENYSGDTRMARLIRVWNFGKRKITLVVRVWRADTRMRWLIGHFVFWWNAYDTRMRQCETRMDAYEAQWYAYGALCVKILFCDFSGKFDDV